MKIISAYTKNIKELSDLSYDSYQSYCTKNSIKFERFEIEETERPPSWYKIKYILNQFNNGENCIMWVDSDTLLLNNDFDLMNIINNDSQIYVSDDIHGINCGVMIWKNTTQTKDILNKIWSLTEFINHPWWEQGAFRKLYEENYNGMVEIVKKIPQKILNAYDYRFYNLVYENGQVDSKSFILHLPGLSNVIRVQIMKNFKI